MTIMTKAANAAKPIISSIRANHYRDERGYMQPGLGYANTAEIADRVVLAVLLALRPSETETINDHVVREWIDAVMEGKA